MITNRMASQNARIELARPLRSSGTDRVTDLGSGFPSPSGCQVATRWISPVRSQRLLSSSSVVTNSSSTLWSPGSRVNSWLFLSSVPEVTWSSSNCQSMGPGTPGGASHVATTVSDPRRGGSSTHPAVPLTGVSRGTSMSALVMVS